MDALTPGSRSAFTSAAFKITHPYASFLIGGGSTDKTRVEFLKAGGSEVILGTVGSFGCFKTAPRGHEPGRAGLLPSPNFSLITAPRERRPTGLWEGTAHKRDRPA